MGESICVSHSPCPRCKSVDNLAIYDDGHSWCFTPGCGYREAGEQEQDQIFEEKNSMEFIKGEIEPLKKRGLTKTTVDKWAYQIGEYKGKKVELNKPKRGDGGKAYVYVRDPKTKKIRNRTSRRTRSRR